MAFTIRQAGPDDAAAVAMCLTAAFEPYRTSYTPAAFADTVVTAEGARQRFLEMTILVAEDEAGEIIGTVAHAVTDSGDGHVRGMAVDPRFHGSGVAARLLAAAEQGLRASGCSRVTLDTTRPLERAMRFYTRHGYQPTGGVTDFFGMPLFEYAKDLT